MNGTRVNSSYDQCNSLERGNEQVHEQDDSTQQEQRLTDGHDPPAWNTLELVVRVVDAAVGCQHIINLATQDDDIIPTTINKWSK